MSVVVRIDGRPMCLTPLRCFAVVLGEEVTFDGSIAVLTSPRGAKPTLTGASIAPDKPGVYRIGLEREQITFVCFPREVLTWPPLRSAYSESEIREMLHHLVIDKVQRRKSADFDRLSSECPLPVLGCNWREYALSIKGN